MSMTLDEFRNYLLDGTKHELGVDVEGGYLVPDTITRETPGFKGWFYRLIGNKRGWYTYRLYDEIMKYARIS